MKKTIAVLLILLLSMSMMAGCSKKKDTKEAETTEEVTAYTKGTSDGGLDFNPEDYVTLGEYKNLSSYEVTCSASEEEINGYIDDELNADAEYPEITDRGAEKGDLLTFDYATTVDGVEVEDCTEEDYEISLGEDEFDKTVEKEMLGRKPDDSFEVKLKLSDDLSVTNAGDEAVMKITVKKLEQQIIPELDEDYAKKKGYDSVDDFKKAMEEQVIADKEEEIDSSLSENLMIEVADNATLKDDYPESLYNTCKEEIDASIESSMESVQGISRSEYLEFFYGMTEEDLDTQYIMETQTHLLVYAIAQKEELFLTEEQFQDYIEECAAEYNMTVEELENEIDRDSFMYEAVNNNVLAFLFDNAKKETITDEEYEKMNASEGEEMEDYIEPEEDADSDEDISISDEEEDAVDETANPDSDDEDASNE